MCTPFDLPANATAGSANNGGGSGEGTFPQVGSTICYDDPNFRNYRTKWSALNLIFWQKRVPCNYTEGVCSQCPRAWRASPEFTVRVGPANNDYPPKTPNPRVILFFKEPVLLTRLRILQLQVCRCVIHKVHSGSRKPQQQKTNVRSVPVAVAVAHRA